MDLSNLVQVMVLIAFVAVEAVVLLVLLTLFQPPGPRSSVETTKPSADPAPTSALPPGPSGSVLQVGFLSRFGMPLGWVICFGVLLALTALSALPGGALLSVVGWWVVALTLFGLTVRQTFKTNIALGLLTFAIALVLSLVPGPR